jgi:hypothetical protein
VIRIGIFGAGVARTLDFVDAFLGGESQWTRSEMEERGTHRVFVADVDHEGRDLRFVVCVPPRNGVGEAFADALASCDAAILVACAAGWEEQAPVVAAFESARADRDVPVVRVVNELVPPRLEHAAPDAAFPRDVLRGRIGWSRHEKSGTEVTRAAVSAALAAVDTRGPLRRIPR